MGATRLSGWFVVLSSVAVAVAACGGGDDGGPVIFLDAGLDAPPGGGGGGAVTGLGQKCDLAMQNADCPANAPICVAVTQNSAWCSPTCLTGGAGMSNAMSQLPLATVMPPPNQAMCTGAYSASVGMPGCVLILQATPAGPIMPNTSYTNITLGCIVFCGQGSACPTGMAAMTLQGSCLCLPQ